MNVTYDPKTKQSGEGFALVQQATKQLEDILGPSSDQVSAEWDRSEDEGGRAFYRLKVKDSTGEAETHFAPDELQSLSQRRIRLYLLWEDLLRARNHKQLQELLDNDNN
jgi:hypothetical protein